MSPGGTGLFLCHFYQKNIIIIHRIFLCFFFFVTPDLLVVDPATILGKITPDLLVTDPATIPGV